MGLSMEHWNGNQCVALDIETTGEKIGFHEIYQVACVALDSNFEPRQDVYPLDMKIQPEHMERIDWSLPIMKRNMKDIMTAHGSGFDSESAKGYFEEWIKKLKLPLNKGGFHSCKIIPLGHNITQFDIPFIRAWLEQDYYPEIFHAHPRDTMIAALYLNDFAGMRAEQVPFSKLTLRWLCNQLGVELLDERAHNALYDCVASAKCYKAMTQRGFRI